MERQPGEHWDTARKGSSVLQASFIRSCPDEICTELNISTATLPLTRRSYTVPCSIPNLCHARAQQ
eukprot:8923911-Pyramimonas_sp.AAC.1